MLDTLDTPTVLVDLKRLGHNIASFADTARATGVNLRPHVKTHKTVEIAQLQRAAGAAGITVAKLSEAAVYAAAGFDDIFVAYPVIGEHKWRHAAELARKCRMIVGVESSVGIEGIAEAAKAAGVVVAVRVEFDSGLRRSGGPIDQIGTLCSEVMRHDELELEGVFTFRSSAFPGSDGRPVASLGKEEGELLAHVASRLREAGFPIRSASGGSTPTGRDVASVPGVTEIRPGTYVFNDLMVRADGACGEDALALSILATVVSRPDTSTAIVDAGSKTLASDAQTGLSGSRVHGELVGGGGYLTWLNEEHGAVTLANNVQPRVGERVRIYPVHVCTVVNLADRLVVVDGDEVVDHWAVEARGCNQ